MRPEFLSLTEHFLMETCIVFVIWQSQQLKFPRVYEGFYAGHCGVRSHWSNYRQYGRRETYWLCHKTNNQNVKRWNVWFDGWKDTKQLLLKIYFSNTIACHLFWEEKSIFKSECVLKLKVILTCGVKAGHPLVMQKEKKIVEGLYAELDIIFAREQRYNSSPCDHFAFYAQETRDKP